MLRRIWVNLRADRQRPPLDRLARTEDPEEFLWAVLPYAARTFSLCIVFLPTRLARPLAVAYLYCRTLDTYEDMLPDARSKAAALERFVEHLERGTAIPRVADDLVKEERERVYLLLLRHLDRIDAVHRGLPGEHQEAVLRLVRRMAHGMAWSAEVFERQEGSLETPEQLAQYCWHVLGTTLLFAEEMVRLDAGLPAAPPFERVRVCSAAGETVQLANVTRDVERDRERGITYHPDLRRDDEAARRRAHAELVLRALRRAPGLTEFLRGLPFGAGPSLARGGGYLLVGTTQAFYQSLADRLGLAIWPRQSRHGLVRRALEFLRCVASASSASAVLRRIDAEFAAAFESGGAAASAPYVVRDGDLDPVALS